MKKYVALVLALILALACTVTAHAANRGWFDFNYEFRYATIYLSNNLTIVGVCEKWWDYEDSDMIQVQIGGNVYLTHSSNVVLSSTKPAW